MDCDPLRLDQFQTHWWVWRSADCTTDCQFSKCPLANAAEKSVASLQSSRSAGIAAGPKAIKLFRATLAASRSCGDCRATVFEAAHDAFLSRMLSPPSYHRYPIPIARRGRQKNRSHRTDEKYPLRLSRRSLAFGRIHGKVASSHFVVAEFINMGAPRIIQYMATTGLWNLLSLTSNHGAPNQSDFFRNCTAQMTDDAGQVTHKSVA